MQNQKTEARLLETNVPVLTNAVEMASQIVNRVAGNEISNTIGGEAVTPSYLNAAVAARMQSLLAPSTGD